MKKYLMLLPVALLSFTGCSTINQMICLVNRSTEAIYGNAEAVEESTEVIRQNADLIQASTETIKENRHQLESAQE